MIFFLKLLLIIIILLIIIFLFINFIKYNNYWYKICLSSNKPDFYKWILSNKYIAKKYASLLGFNIPKTYLLTNNLNIILSYNFPTKYVIKPVDLCDSIGVYLIDNNINKINNTKITITEIIKELKNIRINDSFYYMYYNMFNGKIPFKGYIIEELLLDENGHIPFDYKCYVFGGKLFYIAITYDRLKNNTTTNGDEVSINQFVNNS